VNETTGFELRNIGIMGLEKMDMTGFGRSFKAKPLNSDPRNAGVFSVKINE